MSLNRHLLVAFFAAALSTGASGCRGKSVEVEASGDGDGDGDGEPPISDTPFALNDADELFDATSVPVFEVSMDPERWQYMSDNPTLEEYEEGQLTYNGTEIGPIGLRYKGSVGSLTGCLDEQGELDGCNKLSLKMKFSEIDRNQRFYRMKRLNFHAMARDASKLHDKIGYKAFRDAGIQAPRSTWARLEVNGETLGLFALVEQIDGRFTANRWPDEGDGNLFKETWPLSEDPDDYIEGLKTNEEFADVGTYASFAVELNSANSSEYMKVLDSWMNVDELYTYMAVNDAIANWDGVTAFYCGAWGCGNHNFYMYQHELEDMFTVVPWDLDSTLSAGTPLDHIPHWTNPDDCSEEYPVFGGWINAKSAGCDPVFIALTSERERYESAIDEVLAGPFNIDQIDADIDEYVDFIRDEIEKDPTLSGVEGWLADVESLRSQLPLLKQRVEGFRDGRFTEPVVLVPGGVLDFEDATALGVNLGVSTYNNSASTASMSLNTDTALDGAQDLRIDFVYRDEADPWNQWSVLILTLPSASEDLSSYSGFRVTVRSDQTRDVRFDLESAFQPGADDGARFGWDFQVTDTASTVDLPFADAAIPSWATTAGEQWAEVVTSVSGVLINPGAIRDTSGFIGEGLEDPGFFQIDNIELY